MKDEERMAANTTVIAPFNRGIELDQEGQIEEKSGSGSKPQVDDVTMQC